MMCLQNNKFCFLFFVIILFIAFSCKTDKSQDTEDYPVWIEMMEQPDMEIGKARMAFDKYWENHEHFRGDRSKQFERWYTINSRRLDQYGKVISARQVSSEFQRLKLKSGVEEEGYWFNYGPVNVGPRNGIKRDGGRVKDIEFHPTDSSTFFVSTFKGGLFKTTDYGTTWMPLSDNLIEQVYVCEVSDDNPGIIFIGTELGVYKSIDGGQNWNSTSVTNKTKALLLKENDQNTIIAGNETGIYRSDNNGETWNFVQSANKVEDLDSNPANPDIIYAATNGDPSEFFRSKDGGKTWTKSNAFGKGSFMGIAVTPAEPENVYVLNLRDHLGEDSFEGFYLSEDAGQSFVKKSSYSPCISGYESDGAISRGQPNYNLFICVDPLNPDIVYAGGIHPWKSEDKGKTWTYLNTELTADGGKMHVDQLNWAYSPHDNNIFAANDGGIYLLQEDEKFRTLTDGLPIAEIYECSQSQTVKSNVAGGTMHCGVKLNYNGEWFTPWGGDEATCIIDPTDENYIYHLKYEKISRSSDGGFNFSRINAQDADRGYYTGTGAIDHQDPNILYVGLFEVERTMNARETNVQWEKISGFGGSTRIQKVEQSLANRDIFYVARGNYFYRSDNLSQASPSFTNLTNNLPSSGQVSDISTHPTNSNIVYILLGSRIYKSTDKGITWTNITENLPQVALLEMTIDKLAKEGIYIGTDIGVYYKDTTMTDWVDYSKNLPGVRVSGMDIYYGENRDESFITISTDGRGFWRSLLYGSSTQKPVADFTVDKTSVVVSEEVKITNTSPENNVGTAKWTIKGGNPAITYESNPVVTFNAPGTYQILLEVSNSAGMSSKSINVTVGELQIPEPKISVDNTSVYAGNAVGFQDQSNFLPTSWEWTFEGGEPASSTEKNPSVIYYTPGIYAVSLKVSNSTGSASKTWDGYIAVTENQGSGDLQMHYEFENNFTDISTYKRSLVINGSYQPVFTKDRYGNSNAAYLAPGSNEKYLFNSYMGIAGNGERTVTAWFRTSANGPSRKTIVSWGKNSQGQMFNVMVQDNGNIRVEAGSCSVQSGQANELNNNEWHHVAVTYHASDGDKLKDVKIYVDGKLVSNQSDAAASYRSEVVSINTDNKTNMVRIGSVNYHSYYWVGDLDDVRIYSKSLTPEQIKNVFDLETSTSIIPGSPGIKFFSGKSKIRIDMPEIWNAKAYIYNINGSLVSTNTLNKGKNQIPLKNGIYIAKVIAENKVFAEKVICY